MRKVVLDTDLFSECIKGNDLVVGKHYDAYLAIHKRLTVTSWTVFEVLSGIHHRLPHKLIFYENLFKQAEEIVPSAEDYHVAARIRGALFALVNR